VTLILANAAELWRLLLSEAVSLYTLVTRMYVNVQVPKPRSGVTLCIHSAEDTIYIYGGYSKVSCVTPVRLFLVSKQQTRARLGRRWTAASALLQHQTTVPCPVSVVALHDC
jgi:hypothetical protein